jgi:molybdenum cofactor biosynthesis enzyme MoaA
MPYELNVVLTDFNRKEIPSLLRFCRDQQVLAKFFEHVKALPGGREAGAMRAEAQPYVRLSDFERFLRDTIPCAVGLPPDVFDGTNEI